MRKEYLDELEDHFLSHGTYPYPLKPFVLEEEFRRALQYRGLPLPKSTKPPSLRTNSQLDPVQRAVIRSVANYHDTRPIRTKLKDFNVTTQQYSNFLRQPHFRQALETHLEKNLSSLPQDAKLALSSLILSNDLNAIKYYHELTGIYRPNTETLLNLSLILAQIMDILTRYLRPDQLSSVADALEQVLLSSGGGKLPIEATTLTEAAGEPPVGNE